jgi:hypothetical protein
LAAENVLSQAPSDLGNLAGMLLAGVEYVEFTGAHDLRDSGETVECR